MSSPVAPRPAPASARPLLADVVRDGLRRAIFGGEFAAGSRLPNEDRLSARFAVSRATIREAVRGLVAEGYLVRRQGSGTYVTARPLLHNALDSNFSYTAYLESLGVRAERRILGLHSVPASAVTAERLDLAVGAPVVELRRVRTADGRPAIYSIDELPGDIVDAVRDRAALGGSVYALLASLGHPVAHAEAVVAPAAADLELAVIMGVEPGALLQSLEQVDVSVTGRRVMRSREWHDPAVIELRVFRRGPGAIPSAER